MEIRLPRTELFKLPEELLELEGQCVNGFLGDFVGIPNDIVPQSCRKITNLFPSPCGGGRCKSYRVKDPVGLYKLMESQTQLISGKMNPQDVTNLTVKQQMRGDETYIIDKIVLLNKCEFSQYLVY